MLNRRHIRVKVLQALYSYWAADEEINKLHIERDMVKSLNRLYELYIYLLFFIQELGRFAEKYDDEVKARFIPQENQIEANKKFYNSEIFTRINESEDLAEAAKKYKVVWESDDEDYIRKVFMDLKNTENYKEYLAADEIRQETELEIFEFVIKHYPFSFSLMEQNLEDKFINWFDDGKIAVQMLMKTFKNILTSKSEHFLVPIAQDEKMSFEFASELYNTCLKHNTELEELIITKIEKWEPSRVPLMDMLIIKIGLAEFLYFNSIPVKVTINECIELAKNYSAPNSKKFINGVLDNLLIELNKQGKIKKSGLGLANS